MITQTHFELATIPRMNRDIDERRRGAPGRGNPELGGMIPTGREIDP